MIPVYQTILTPPDGDCLAACLASIFEVPLATIPNWIRHDDWHDRYDRWLGQFGLQWWSFPNSSDWFPRGYSIASVASGHTEYEHATVALDGTIVHNPMPDWPNGRELGKVLHWTVFAVLDPVKPASFDALRVPA